jgi:hypothetical protein
LLQICVEEHPQCKYSDSPGLPENFRVIDVRNRCLSEKPQDRFAALSYVWGRDVDQYIITCKNNFDELKVAGSLSRLPQTLEDAISVCEQLQERFLWVDRLCIIQDDTQDKAQQIQAMGKIFSAAHLVIIAAYGDGMHFGIPGISFPRLVTQITVDLPEMTVTNCVHDRRTDCMAVWDTRAW